LWLFYSEGRALRPVLTFDLILEASKRGFFGLASLFSFYPSLAAVQANFGILADFSILSWLGSDGTFFRLP